MVADRETRIAEEAVRRGLLAEDQARQCLEALRRLSRTPYADRESFGTLAVRRGYLSPEQVREVEEALADREQGGKSPAAGGLAVTPRRPEAALFSIEGAYRTIGGYRLLGRIGEGGSGTVYKARDQQTGQLAALKLLDAHLARDAAVVERFRREAALYTRLRHPHVVECLKTGCDAGRYYIATEYLGGGDVLALLRRGGPMGEARVLNIGLDVAKGLEAAWRLGLVHRDIKPSNLLWGQDGEIKLADWGAAGGTAAATAAPLFEAAPADGGQSPVGTPYYLAPEQAVGASDIDVRADIYALGSTLYHLATGRPPFTGGEAAEIVARHLTETPASPRQLNPQLSEDFSFIVGKMLRKDRAERYQDPTELIADLERALAGQPVPRDDGGAAGRRHAASAVAEPQANLVLLPRKRRTFTATSLTQGLQEAAPTPPPSAFLGTRMSRAVLGVLLITGVGLIVHLLSAPRPQPNGGEGHGHAALGPGEVRLLSEVAGESGGWADPQLVGAVKHRLWGEDFEGGEGKEFDSGARFRGGPRGVGVCLMAQGHPDPEADFALLIRTEDLAEKNLRLPPTAQLRFFVKVAGRQPKVRLTLVFDSGPKDDNLRRFVFTSTPREREWSRIFLALPPRAAPDKDVIKPGDRLRRIILEGGLKGDPEAQLLVDDLLLFESQAEVAGDEW